MNMKLTTEQTYNGYLAYDAETYCCPEDSPVGTGKTEQEAIGNLADKVA